MSVSTNASPSTETNTPDEELVNALDYVIELVKVTPPPDHKDIQLLPDGYNENLD